MEENSITREIRAVLQRKWPGATPQHRLTAHPPPPSPVAHYRDMNASTVSLPSMFTDFAVRYTPASHALLDFSEDELEKAVLAATAPPQPSPSLAPPAHAETVSDVFEWPAPRPVAPRSSTSATVGVNSTSSLYDGTRDTPQLGTPSLRRAVSAGPQHLPATTPRGTPLPPRTPSHTGARYAFPPTPTGLQPHHTVAGSRSLAAPSPMFPPTPRRAVSSGAGMGGGADALSLLSPGIRQRSSLPTPKGPSQTPSHVHLQPQPSPAFAFPLPTTSTSAAPSAAPTPRAIGPLPTPYARRTMPLLTPVRDAEAGTVLPLHIPQALPTPRSAVPTPRPSVRAGQRDGAEEEGVAVSAAVLVNYYTHEMVLAAADAWKATAGGSEKGSESRMSKSTGISFLSTAKPLSSLAVARLQHRLSAAMLGPPPLPPVALAAMLGQTKGRAGRGNGAGAVDAGVGAGGIGVSGTTHLLMQGLVSRLFELSEIHGALRAQDQCIAAARRRLLAIDRARTRIAASLVRGHGPPMLTVSSSSSNASAFAPGASASGGVGGGVADYSSTSSTTPSNLPAMSSTPSTHVPPLSVRTAPSLFFSTAESPSVGSKTDVSKADVTKSDIAKAEHLARAWVRRVASGGGDVDEEDGAAEAVPLSPVSLSLLCGDDVDGDMLLLPGEDEAAHDAVGAHPVLFPLLFQPTRAYLDKQLQALGDAADEYAARLEAAAEHARVDAGISNDEPSPRQNDEDATFLTPRLGPSAVPGERSRPRTPLSPRSPYSPPRASGMTSPSGGGLLSPSAVTRFLNSIRVGHYVDVRDCHSKWFHARIVAIDESGFTVHFDGWPDAYDELIFHSAARTHIAPLETRARTADRRTRDPHLMFDMTVARANQPPEAARLAAKRGGATKTAAGTIPLSTGDGAFSFTTTITDTTPRKDMQAKHPDRAMRAAAGVVLDALGRLQAAVKAANEAVEEEQRARAALGLRYRECTRQTIALARSLTARLPTHTHAHAQAYVQTQTFAHADGVPILACGEALPFAAVQWLARWLRLAATEGRVRGLCVEYHAANDDNSVGVGGLGGTGVGIDDNTMGWADMVSYLLDAGEAAVAGQPFQPLFRRTKPQIEAASGATGAREGGKGGDMGSAKKGSISSSVFSFDTPSDSVGDSRGRSASGGAGTNAIVGAGIGTGTAAGVLRPSRIEGVGTSGSSTSASTGLGMGKNGPKPLLTTRGPAPTTATTGTGTGTGSGTATRSDQRGRRSLSVDVRSATDSTQSITVVPADALPDVGMGATAVPTQKPWKGVGAGLASTRGPRPGVHLGVEDTWKERPGTLPGPVGSFQRAEEEVEQEEEDREQGKIVIPHMPLNAQVALAELIARAAPLVAPAVAISASLGAIATTSTSATLNSTAATTTATAAAGNGGGGGAAAVGDVGEVSMLDELIGVLVDVSDEAVWLEHSLTCTELMARARSGTVYGEAEIDGGGGYGNGAAGVGSGTRVGDKYRGAMIDLLDDVDTIPMEIEPVRMPLAMVDEDEVLSLSPVDTRTQPQTSTAAAHSPVASRNLLAHMQRLVGQQAPIAPLLTAPTAWASVADWDPMAEQSARARVSEEVVCALRALLTADDRRESARSVIVKDAKRKRSRSGSLRRGSVGVKTSAGTGAGMVDSLDAGIGAGVDEIDVTQRLRDRAGSSSDGKGAALRGEDAKDDVHPRARGPLRVDAGGSGSGSSGVLKAEERRSSVTAITAAEGMELGAEADAKMDYETDEKKHPEPDGREVGEVDVKLTCVHPPLSMPLTHVGAWRQGVALRLLHGLISLPHTALALATLASGLKEGGRSALGAYMSRGSGGVSEELLSALSGQLLGALLLPRLRRLVGQTAAVLDVLGAYTPVLRPGEAVTVFAPPVNSGRLGIVVAVNPADDAVMVRVVNQPLGPDTGPEAVNQAGLAEVVGAVARYRADNSAFIKAFEETSAGVEAAKARVAAEEAMRTSTPTSASAAEANSISDATRSSTIAGVADIGAGDAGVGAPSTTSATHTSDSSIPVTVPMEIHTNSSHLVVSTNAALPRARALAPPPQLWDGLGLPTSALAAAAEANARAMDVLATLLHPAMCDDTHTTPPSSSTSVSDASMPNLAGTEGRSRPQSRQCSAVEAIARLRALPLSALALALQPLSTGTLDRQEEALPTRGLSLGGASDSLANAGDARTTTTPGIGLEVDDEDSSLRMQNYLSIVRPSHIIMQSLAIALVVVSAVAAHAAPGVYSPFAALEDAITAIDGTGDVGSSRGSGTGASSNDRSSNTDMHHDMKKTAALMSFIDPHNNTTSTTSKTSKATKPYQHAFARPSRSVSDIDPSVPWTSIMTQALALAAVLEMRLVAVAAHWQREHAEVVLALEVSVNGVGRAATAEREKAGSAPGAQGKGRTLTQASRRGSSTFSLLELYTASLANTSLGNMQVFAPAHTPANANADSARRDSTDTSGMGSGKDFGHTMDHEHPRNIHDVSMLLRRPLAPGPLMPPLQLSAGGVTARQRWAPPSVAATAAALNCLCTGSSQLALVRPPKALRQLPAVALPRFAVEITLQYKTPAGTAPHVSSHKGVGSRTHSGASLTSVVPPTPRSAARAALSGTNAVVPLALKEAPPAFPERRHAVLTLNTNAQSELALVLSPTSTAPFPTPPEESQFVKDRLSWAAFPRPPHARFTFLANPSDCAATVAACVNEAAYLRVRRCLLGASVRLKADISAAISAELRNVTSRRHAVIVGTARGMLQPQDWVEIPVPAPVPVPTHEQVPGVHTTSFDEGRAGVSDGFSGSSWPEPNAFGMYPFSPDNSGTTKNSPAAPVPFRGLFGSMAALSSPPSTAAPSRGSAEAYLSHLTGAPTHSAGTGTSMGLSLGVGAGMVAGSRARGASTGTSGLPSADTAHYTPAVTSAPSLASTATSAPVEHPLHSMRSITLCTGVAAVLLFFPGSAPEAGPLMPFSTEDQSAGSEPTVRGITAPLFSSTAFSSDNLPRAAPLAPTLADGSDLSATWRWHEVDANGRVRARGEVGQEEIEVPQGGDNGTASFSGARGEWASVFVWVRLCDIEAADGAHVAALQEALSATAEESAGLPVSAALPTFGVDVEGNRKTVSESGKLGLLAGGERPRYPPGVVGTDWLRADCIDIADYYMAPSHTRHTKKHTHTHDGGDAGSSASGGGRGRAIAPSHLFSSALTSPHSLSPLTQTTRLSLRSAPSAILWSLHRKQQILFSHATAISAASAAHARALLAAMAGLGSPEMYGLDRSAAQRTMARRLLLGPWVDEKGHVAMQHGSGVELARMVALPPSLLLPTTPCPQPLLPPATWTHLLPTARPLHDITDISLCSDSLHYTATSPLLRHPALAGPYSQATHCWPYEAEGASVWRAEALQALVGVLLLERRVVRVTDGEGSAEEADEDMGGFSLSMGMDDQWGAWVDPFASDTEDEAEADTASATKRAKLALVCRHEAMVASNPLLDPSAAPPLHTPLRLPSGACESLLALTQRCIADAMAWAAHPGLSVTPLASRAGIQRLCVEWKALVRPDGTVLRAPSLLLAPIEGQMGVSYSLRAYRDPDFAHVAHSVALSAGGEVLPPPLLLPNPCYLQWACTDEEAPPLEDLYADAAAPPEAMYSADGADSNGSGVSGGGSGTGMGKAPGQLCLPAWLFERWDVSATPPACVHQLSFLAEVWARVNAHAHAPYALRDAAQAAMARIADAGAAVGTTSVALGPKWSVCIGSGIGSGNSCSGACPPPLRAYQADISASTFASTAAPVDGMVCPGLELLRARAALSEMDVRGGLRLLARASHPLNRERAALLPALAAELDSVAWRSHALYTPDGAALPPPPHLAAPPTLDRNSSVEKEAQLAAIAARKQGMSGHIDLTRVTMLSALSTCLTAVSTTPKALLTSSAALWRRRLRTELGAYLSPGCGAYDHADAVMRHNLRCCSVVVGSERDSERDSEGNGEGGGAVQSTPTLPLTTLYAAVSRAATAEASTRRSAGPSVTHTMLAGGLPLPVPLLPTATFASRNSSTRPLSVSRSNSSLSLPLPLPSPPRHSSGASAPPDTPLGPLQRPMAASKPPQGIHDLAAAFVSRLAGAGIAERACARHPWLRLREWLLAEVAGRLERETGRVHEKTMNRERVQVKGLQWPLILGRSALTARILEALVSIEHAITTPWGAPLLTTQAPPTGHSGDTAEVPTSSLLWTNACFSGVIYWEEHNAWKWACVDELTLDTRKDSEKERDKSDDTAVRDVVWRAGDAKAMEEMYSICVWADGGVGVVYEHPVVNVLPARSAAGDSSTSGSGSGSGASVRLFSGDIRALVSVQEMSLTILHTALLRAMPWYTQLLARKHRPLRTDATAYGVSEWGGAPQVWLGDLGSVAGGRRGTGQGVVAEAEAAYSGILLPTAESLWAAARQGMADGGHNAACSSLLPCGARCNVTPTSISRCRGMGACALEWVDKQARRGDDAFSSGPQSPTTSGYWMCRSHAVPSEALHVPAMEVLPMVVTLSSRAPGRHEAHYGDTPAVLSENACALQPVHAEPLAHTHTPLSAHAQALVLTLHGKERGRTHSLLTSARTPLMNRVHGAAALIRAATARWCGQALWRWLTRVQPVVALTAFATDGSQEPPLNASAPARTVSNTSLPHLSPQQVALPAAAAATVVPGLSAALLAQLQGLHVAVEEVLEDEAAPRESPLTDLLGEESLEQAERGIVVPEPKVLDSSARLPPRSPATTGQCWLLPPSALRPCPFTDAVLQGKPSQSETDSLCLLDLGPRSLWRTALQWMPAHVPGAVGARDEPVTVTVDAEEGERSLSTQRHKGIPITGTPTTPLAALLLPSRRKRERLWECYLLATARIHCDNAPVVKLELPFRDDRPTTATTQETGELHPVLSPSPSLATSLPFTFSLTAQSSATGTIPQPQLGSPRLSQLTLRAPSMAPSSSAPVAPRGDEQPHVPLPIPLSLLSPLPSPPPLAPPSPTTADAPLPEPLIIQFCRRLRDARCHHLRVAPAQYALRVLLIGAANLGAIGYPGPFRAAMTELARQLNEAAASSHTGAEEQFTGLLEEGGEMVVWSEDGDEAGAGLRAFVDVYRHEMLDWGATGDGVSQGAGGRIQLGPEAGVRRRGGPTSTAPPLLCLCNNGRERVGGNREWLALCPAATSPGELHLWGAIGTAAGMAVRTGCALEVDLGGGMWPMLMGEAAAGGPAWIGRSAGEESVRLLLRLGLVAVAARGWVQPSSTCALTTATCSTSTSAAPAANNGSLTASPSVLVDTLSVDWGISDTLPSYFPPASRKLTSKPSSAVLQPQPTASVPALTARQACALRWTPAAASALRAMAESDYSRAQTLLAGDGDGAAPPAVWAAAGERRLEAPIDDAADRVHSAPLGPFGACLSLTYAQRLPFALALLSHAGLLQALPGIPTQAPRPPRCDPLLPSAWPAAHAAALVAHAFCAGAAAVLPHPRAAAATVPNKRPRFPGTLFAQGRAPAESLGAGMGLWTADEWRVFVCGERDVDTNLLRASAVVKHAREGAVSVAIESEEEGEDEAILPREQARARPTDTVTASGVFGPRTGAEEPWLSQVPQPLRQSHRVERWFWEVLDEMSPLDRARFLFFAWGARRLPPSQDRDGTHLTLQIINHQSGGATDNKANDGRLPSAHTCFMIVEMPLYSTKEQLRLQLMRALECQGING